MKLIRSFFSNMFFEFHSFYITIFCQNKLVIFEFFEKKMAFLDKFYFLQKSNKLYINHVIVSLVNNE